MTLGMKSALPRAEVWVVGTLVGKMLGDVVRVFYDAELHDGPSPAEQRAREFVHDNGASYTAVLAATFNTDAELAEWEASANERAKRLRGRMEE